MKIIPKVDSLRVPMFYLLVVIKGLPAIWSKSLLKKNVRFIDGFSEILIL